MAEAWRRAVRGRASPAIRRAMLVGLISVIGACTEPAPPMAGHASPSPTTVGAFDGVLRCVVGDEAGAAIWDYGAHPRGTIEDPVRWVRSSAVGLDPELALSYLDRAGEFDNVVVVSMAQGRVVGFVTFGLDEERSRFFPLRSGSCASSGIDDFT